ncbi:MAG: translation initiation factor IF-3 [Firmicutes bacterium]|nr:translation initiation factor IF-3 [Bacillota bacterium]
MKRGVTLGASAAFLCWDRYEHSGRCSAISREDVQINDAIRAREVRLIDENNTQMGIVGIRDALRIAVEKDLDLVNVAPTAKPPVCRIMDYGKFKYEQSKKEKDARKNQKVVAIKEIRMTPNIEDHDFDTKVKAAIKFLQEGDKVKAAVRFRGREITHPAIGQAVLEKMVKELEPYGILERSPRLEGRNMIIILNPRQATEKTS